MIGFFSYLKFIYDPTVKRYTGLQKQRSDLIQEVKRLEADASGFKDISSLQSRIDKLEKETKGGVPLTDEGDMETVLAVEVIGKAEKNNLRPVKYAVSDAGQIKKKAEAILHKKSYYDVTLEGEYLNLLRFLKEVSYLPHMLTVERLEIESKDGRLEIALLLGMG